MRSLGTRAVAALVLAVAGVSLAAPVLGQSADTLRARHHVLAAELKSSPFGRPLLLQSNASMSDPQGDIYAIVEHPFRTVGAALQRAADWCDVLILQFNIKRCVPSADTLRVAIGRTADEPVEQAYQLDFRYAVRAARNDYLSVQMQADVGPLGTRDYRIVLEAVPLDARRSFVHLSYAYAAGFAARLATEAYLATAGRDKVGFTVIGRDDAGAARYVGGIRGVAERNTMRCFLAIEAFLDALVVPDARRLDARLHEWFAATERYPRQLREMRLEQYLAMKRREVSASRADARG